MLNTTYFLEILFDINSYTILQNRCPHHILFYCFSYPNMIHTKLYQERFRNGYIPEI